MTTSRNGLFKNIDWALVLCYLVLIVIGWINIYASIHSSEPSSIFDRKKRKAVYMDGDQHSGGRTDHICIQPEDLREPVPCRIYIGDHLAHSSDFSGDGGKGITVLV